MYYKICYQHKQLGEVVLTIIKGEEKAENKVKELNLDKSSFIEYYKKEYEEKKI